MPSNETLAAAAAVMDALFAAYPAQMGFHILARTAAYNALPVEARADAIELIEERGWAWVEFNGLEASASREDFVRDRFAELRDALRVAIPDPALSRHLYRLLDSAEECAVDEAANRPVEWSALKAEMGLS
jgi:hypothetical protein